MLKSVFCIVLLTLGGICLADEPLIPLAPETSVVQPSLDGAAPPLPTFDPSVNRAAAAPYGATVPGTTMSAPHWRASAGQVPYVYYRPEAVVPPANEGWHVRYPYYSYRRPWYPPGPGGVNVTIVW